MKKFKLGLIVILVVLLTAVVLQNREDVRVHFLWVTGEMPAVLLLFLTAIGGFLLGLIVSMFVKTSTRPQSKPDKSS